jgi:peptidylprolyl isomerase
LVACVAQAADDTKDWRAVDPDNLVLIGTKYGEVAVELSPKFAPKHVERMRALIRAHFFDGTNFYRVIEGFVAQGGVGRGHGVHREQAGQESGDAEEMAGDEGGVRAALGPRRARSRRRARPICSRSRPAMSMASRSGAIRRRRPNGSSIAPARSPSRATTMPIRRPTEFYIVIGEAPRRLDRNLTAFGRVIDGMQYVQKLQRGDPAVDNGVIADKTKQDPIT